MSAASRRLLAYIPLLVVFLLVSRWLERSRERPVAPAPAEVSPPPSPRLLEPRQATAQDPLQSWERLLVRDGGPSEDRAALEDIVTNYLQTLPDSRRPPMGTNDEIARALTDTDALGDAALPIDHPALVGGRLVDRWGSPWHFHQLSADVIEVRSAGPDRRLFTSDDVVPSGR